MWGLVVGTLARESRPTHFFRRPQLGWEWRRMTAVQNVRGPERAPDTASRQGYRPQGCHLPWLHPGAGPPLSLSLGAQDDPLGKMMGGNLGAALPFLLVEVQGQKATVVVGRADSGAIDPPPFLAPQL